ncbi:conserved hypothetical protein, partial [Ricinus communis]
MLAGCEAAWPPRGEDGAADRSVGVAKRRHDQLHEPPAGKYVDMLPAPMRTLARTDDERFAHLLCLHERRIGKRETRAMFAIMDLDRLAGRPGEGAADEFGMQRRQVQRQPIDGKAK